MREILQGAHSLKLFHDFGALTIRRARSAQSVGPRVRTKLLVIEPIDECRYGRLVDLRMVRRVDQDDFTRSEIAVARRPESGSADKCCMGLRQTLRQDRIRACIGRIFCGEPLHTSPENALVSRERLEQMTLP